MANLLALYCVHMVIGFAESGGVMVEIRNYTMNFSSDVTRCAHEFTLEFYNFDAGCGMQRILP